MMLWRKLGIVYGPPGTQPWASSHAMIPTPVRFDADTVRVYVTFCDRAGVGRPGYVDVAASDPTQVLRVSREPLFDIGEPGTFDENGVLTCSVTSIDDRTKYLYYAGFELGTKVRYRLLTGMAVSEDGGTTFRRISRTPVLERSNSETLFRCGPFCTYESGKFQMWYIGGSDWTEVEGKQVPVYDLRYLESANGVDWGPEGEVVLKVTDGDEHGFGRPYLIPKAGGGHRLFYSIRKRSVAGYRLGYAESHDERSWRRMDERLNLLPSAAGFDDQAIMYAAPIDIDGRLYVFYNGNDFGRAGFAAAVLEGE